jgi:hypothetical protein
VKRRPQKFAAGTQVMVIFVAELAEDFAPGDHGLFYRSVNGGRRFLWFGQRGVVKAVKPRVRRQRRKGQVPA